VRHGCCHAAAEARYHPLSQLQHALPPFCARDHCSNTWSQYME
jgi:hypothetical protein